MTTLNPLDQYLSELSAPKIKSPSKESSQSTSYEKYAQEKEAMWLTESGGKQFNPDGSVVTSPKGAKGIAQVMPSTGPEAAALAGLPWDPFAFEFDVNYNRKLGSAYFDRKVEEFDGDLEKAQAAYNTGAGNVRKAINKANEFGGPWQQYVSPETQNYLLRNADNREKASLKAGITSNNIDPLSKYLTELSSSEVVPSGSSEKQSVFGTAASHAVAELAPAVGFFAAGSRTAALAAPVAAAAGIPTVGLGFAAVEAIAFLAGGLGASYGVREVQDMLLPSEAKQYLLKGTQDNKYWALGGSLAAYTPMSGFGLPYKVLTSGEKVLNKPSIVALAGLGGGLDAAVQYAQTGEVDLGQLAINTVASPFMGGALTKLGQNIAGPSSIPVSATLDQNIVDFSINATNQIKHDEFTAFQYGAQLRTATNGNEQQLVDITHDLSINSKTGLRNEPRIMPEVDRLAKLDSLTARHRSLVRDSELNIGDPNHPSHFEKIKLETRIERMNKSGPNEHLIPVVEAIRNTLDELGIKARDAGVIKGLRHNYVSNIIDRTKSNLSEEQITNIIDDFFKSKGPSAHTDSSEFRLFDTADELQDFLTASGSGLYVQRNIADIMQSYLSSMNRAITEKHFVDTLSRTELGQETLGNIPVPPPVVKTGKAAKPAKVVKPAVSTTPKQAAPKTQPTAFELGLAAKAAREAKAAKNVVDLKLPVITDNVSIAHKYNYVLYSGPNSGALNGKYVHPDFAKHVDHLFRQRDIGKIKKALYDVSMLVKTFNVIGSLFHVPSLGWALAGASPTLAFKEIITGGSGIRKAVKNLREGSSGEYVDIGVRSGLMIGTEDVQRTIVADLGHWADSKIGVKALQHITHPLDKYILQKLNTFTWDYMHTGGKLALFEKLQKNAEKHISVPKFEADGVTLNPTWVAVRDQVAKETAHSVNITMGGLQWQMAGNALKSKIGKQIFQHGSGIESRAWGQVALFAPDWTISTIMAFTQGLPKELLKPSHWDIKGGLKGIAKPMTASDLARRYTIHTGLLWLTLLNGINIATSGQFIWDNADPTRIQHKDGTTQQLAKHSMEAVHWLLDPIKTLRNKLGFVPKAALVGLDDRSGGMLERVGNLGKLALPFAAGSALQAPRGEALSRGLWSSAGFPVYGGSTDPLDIIANKIERRETRFRNKLEKLKEAREKSKRNDALKDLRGLFDF